MSVGGGVHFFIFKVTFIILQKGPERQGQKNYSSLTVEKMPKGIVSDAGKKEGGGSEALRSNFIRHVSVRVRN